MNLKKIKDAIRLEREPSLEEQFMTMYDEDLLKDIVQSAFPDVVEDLVINNDLTVEMKLARPLTSKEAKQLQSLGFDANIGLLNKTGWITVDYNPVNYEFVEDAKKSRKS